MAILRRDDAPSDPLGPTMLYLWQKKWWVIVPAALVAILTFIVLRIVREEYRASAEIYVSRFALGNRQQEEVPSPVTAAKLLESTSLIALVRDDFQNAFNLDKVPKLEDFAKGFRVKTDTLQDTSIRKDAMPVIALTVQAQGTSETRFLMESWLKHIIAQFGNYATREAVQKRDALLAQSATIQAELRKAEAEDTRLRSEVLFQQKLLGEQMDILAPAQPPTPMATSPDKLRLDPEGSNNLRLTVNTQRDKPTGLLLRLSQLEVQLALAKAGAATSPTLAIETEMAAVNGVISHTSDSISTLQKTVASLEQELANQTRQVVLQTSQLREIHNSLDRFTALAAVADHGTSGDLVGADLQVLSRPVAPELKVWPKRSVSAVLAGLAVGILCILALLAHRYLTALAERANHREAV